MPESQKSWKQCDFGLDSRLIKAVGKLGFSCPTEVQARCIPIALQGKDILVRSRTGSGKTLAFALPILNKILLEKNSLTSDENNDLIALILAPTRELCKQIDKQIQDLLYFCRDFITVCCLSDDNNSESQFRLQRKHDIIIATPARIAQHCRVGDIDLSHLKFVIIDEADLVLSLGYNEELSFITSKIPKIIQGFLISATLSPQLEKFKKVILHNPVSIRVDDSASQENLLQFYLETTEGDKYLSLYVFIKLGLLQGKGLIFVNDINKGYKVKLFLQQFFISSAVLNSELPLNSRLHIIEEYNRGVFDLLVATDSCFDLGHVEDSGDATKTPETNDDHVQEPNHDFDAENEEGSDNDSDADDLEGVEWMSESTNEPVDHVTVIENNLKTSSIPSTHRNKILKESNEYGVARGIDFQDVSFVINFDFPVTATSYTHRIGRTARGSKIGTSLSFITQPNIVGKLSHKPLSRLEQLALKSSQRDMEVLRQVRSSQPRLHTLENDNILAAIRPIDSSMSTTFDDESKKQPIPLNFDMKELDSFRYRVEDTLRSVTSVSVKEFRTAEIKREILNSAKLKSYFSENQSDLTILRHDKSILHPIRQKPHLKAVPNYLIPNSMKAIADTNPKKSKKRKTNAHGQTQEQRIQKSKSRDPLNSVNPGVYQSNDADTGNYVEELNGNNQDEEIARDDGPQSQEKRLFTTKEASRLGHSAAGRREWQERHKKGKFNTKQAKKSAHRTPGTFMKVKNYK